MTSAGATDWVPLSGNHNDSVILAEGYQMQPGESVISPANADVTPGYFESMGVTLTRGRFFDQRDVTGAPPVLIIDEKLATSEIGSKSFTTSYCSEYRAPLETCVFQTPRQIV